MSSAFVSNFAHVKCEDFIQSNNQHRTIIYWLHEQMSCVGLEPRALDAAIAARQLL